MCGRFNLRTSGKDLAAVFGLDEIFDFPPRYNIAPTQGVLTLKQGSDHGGLEAVEMKWGLIPSWAKDTKIAASTINAKAETVAEKPAFRSAFKKRRCLIPATGFYEWKKLDAKNKQPYAIGMGDDSPFAFAGLFEWWRSPEGEDVESCTIITTEANELVTDIHNRMPVILPREHYQAWTDPANADLAALQAMLAPYPASLMKAWKVGTAVGNVRNQGAELMTPMNSA